MRPPLNLLVMIFTSSRWAWTGPPVTRNLILSFQQTGFCQFVLEELENILFPVGDANQQYAVSPTQKPFALITAFDDFQFLLTMDGMIVLPSLVLTACARRS
jgi:hypothetical protein